MAALIAFLKSIPEIWVLLISMIPFIELRGAIPVGAALGLPFYSNFGLAILGNMIPVPFILLLMPKILSFLSRFKIFSSFVNWLVKKADKNKSKVIADGAEQNGEKIKMNAKIFLALTLFVGIPLPGTGAWCGTLVASLFKLEKKYAFLSVLLGVILSGVIMTLASYGIVGFLNFLA